MRFSFLTIAYFAALLEASPLTGNHVVHEKRDAAPKRWIKRGALPDSSILPVRIGLQQRNLDAGHERLMAMSDMNHPSYGKHMTAEEVIDFFAPPQRAIDTVRDWLEAAGIASERIGHSVNKQWVQVDMTVAEAEELFKTKYHSYEHTYTGNWNIGCDEYVRIGSCWSSFG